MQNESEFPSTAFASTQFAPSTVVVPLESTRLPVRFTGSGSEYFRIWIVNLLLTFVTLSLYLPFARARRLAYFQGNTLVGEHALGFHGDPWKMFRGYLLVAALGITYSLASKMSTTAAFVAVAAMAAVWPALWRASLQFRAANTSWRGVRMRFEGNLEGAYNAMLPAFLPFVFMVLTGLTVDGKGATGELEAQRAMTEKMGWLMGAIGLGAFVLAPWFMARIKRYQHGHYAYASEQTRLGAGTGAFYGLAFKLMGVSLLSILAVGLLTVAVVAIAGGMAVLGAVFSRAGPMGHGGLAAVVAIVVMVSLFYLTLFMLYGPYFTSRSQNLVWGTTASNHLRFQSQLRFLPLLKVSVINFLLTVLTLGLYRPFAAVATARLRLESMTLEVDGNVDQWVSANTSGMNDATGDLAGDFFGIDIGL